MPAYANGWYGGARTPAEFAAKARDVVAGGYDGMKFDPFGTAWKDLPAEESEAAVDRVAAVREAIERELAALEGRGRVLVRPSGTEQLVRVMVEAPTQEQADAVAARLAEVVAKVD